MLKAAIETRIVQNNVDIIQKVISKLCKKLADKEATKENHRKFEKQKLNLMNQDYKDIDKFS